MVSFPKRYLFHQIGTSPPSGQSRHHRLPLVLPISLLLSEAFLPPLRFTLTHFTLLSYEQALRLPTSFPISGLAKLGVKPRLCRSSWRAFASTHPLVLPSTCSRETVLACPLFPTWNLPSFTVESTLSTPCSRSDPPLTRQGAALAHLDSLPLMIWYSEQTALFLFVLARAAPAFLEYLTFVRSSLPCPLLHLFCYLKLCGRSGKNCLLFPPVLSDYNGSPDTRFFRGTTWLMSWLDGERYLRPPQPFVVSLLLSLVSTLVFSWTGGVLSHQNSLTNRLSRFPPRNLCSLVTPAVSSLVFAITDTAFF